jgi:23S rRNA pseudouridine1911/1915/1917 synthase
MQVLKVLVKPQKDRLDQFVSEKIRSLSRSKAKKLIEENFILVNNKPAQPSYKVAKGDRIKVEIPVQKQIKIKPEAIALEIVYEDKDLIVINKPAGMVVHPTLNHTQGTVVNALLSHLEKLPTSDNRPGIVHRLDKNTSGLLIIGKTLEAVEDLKRQFKNRIVKKTYLALVHGRVEKERGQIKGRLNRHPTLRSKFIVSEEGKEAETLYRVLERFKTATLLEVEPLTGRTHQIRVHLSFLGHPIVGDKLYGGKMFLKRQFLHARSLELFHPVSKKVLKFESQLPKDLSGYLEKLRKQS